MVVQSKNVYPDMLLARLLFALGAAASSVMVTAILPSIAASSEKVIPTPLSENQILSASINAETINDPEESQNKQNSDVEKMSQANSSSRLAGIVGFTTGVGALVALLFFLRLPVFLQHLGNPPSRALRKSYYLVAVYSLLLSFFCYVGLRHLHGEDAKSWRKLFKKVDSTDVSYQRGSLLVEAAKLGIRTRSLGLSYLGGFVARASSVGISTFIPLFVNTYFISSGFCDTNNRAPDDIKLHCREAYTLSAKLTGVSQTAALAFALVFGFTADRYRQSNAVLILAALVGFLGYLALGVVNNPMTDRPRGTPFVYVIMVMLGIGQIGTIVCSLALLGRSVLGTGTKMSDQIRDDESAVLLPKNEEGESYEHMKGEIAGVYSLAGGFGILLLTKIGGLLFDKISTAAPFFILAFFNATLIAAGILDAITSSALEN